MLYVYSNAFFLTGGQWAAPASSFNSDNHGMQLYRLELAIMMYSSQALFFFFNVKSFQIVISCY